MSERLTGIVKFFSETKGYGFIAPDGGAADVFVHISKVEESGLDKLNENQKVSFETQPSRKPGKGPEAFNLKAEG